MVRERRCCLSLPTVSADAASPLTLVLITDVLKNNMHRARTVNRCECNAIDDR